MKSSQDHELKRILDEAFRAFEAGDDANARRLCRDALAIDPDSGTAHSLLGLLYEREGKRHDATHEFAKVVTQSPQSQAERETLARLRGLPVGQEEFVEERSNGPLIAIAAVAALLVFGGIFAAFRSFNNYVDDRAGNSTVVASANIEADLELAREAFSSGRYETAMQAAGRVLKADPDNAVAREIYDRSQAFLRGAQAQPAPAPTTPPQVVAPAQPDNVRSAPAVPQPRATDPSAGTAAGGSTLPPVAPRRIMPNNGSNPPASGTLPSISAPGGVSTVPGSTRQMSAADVVRTASRPPASGYDRTARPRANTRGTVTPPRQLPSQRSYDQTVDDTDRAEQPKPTTGAGQGDARVEKQEGYVKVEVTPRKPATEPAPEVTPGDGGTPSASASGNDQPADPVVAEYQERQRQLREARERQKALAARRAEREQGQ